MKAIEVILFWVAIVVLIGIGIGRFFTGAPSVLGYSAASLISLVNTVLLLAILARLHSK